MREILEFKILRLKKNKTSRKLFTERTKPDNQDLQRGPARISKKTPDLITILWLKNIFQAYGDFTICLPS